MSGNIKTISNVEEEIRFLERSLKRLKFSFRMEKEEALELGEKGLLALRNKSRTFYQPSASKIQNDYRLLCYKTNKIENISSGIFQRLEILDKAIKDAIAIFTGTPNRLLRLFKQNTGDN